MATLLGLYRYRADAEQVAERLRASGASAEVVDDPAGAEERAREEIGSGPDGAGSPTMGASMGMLTSTPLGAIPGALFGKIVGRWLTKDQARQYREYARNGGAVVVVEVPDQPVALAGDVEAVLRTSGAEHVHTGERLTI